MDRMKISVAAMLAVVFLFVGMHYATDNGSNSASFFKLPEFNSSQTTADETPITTLKDFNDAIVNIADRTNQSVVIITTTQTVTQRQQSPFSFFFNDPRFDQEREFTRQGLGSGVIVSDDGYILTNNHVIENAEEISIQLYDGDQMDAEVVGADPQSDIAVLKIDADDLPAIAMGNSDDIRVGEMVLAIGSPLGQQFAHSVSMGIVSASGRSSLGLNAYENYIQTDAAINPGNSGGALINLDGELVGINTAIASRTGGYQGLGFAIPVNMARDVMEALITEGRVARGFLGISYGGDVDQTMARALGLERPRGTVVGSVQPDSPADEAGLQEGDVILELNGEEVEGWRNFQVAVGSMKPGADITIEIFRDGERMSIEAELSERDDSEIAGNNLNNDRMEDLREKLGFTVDDLSNSIRSQLNLSENVQGVVINSISQGSQAYRQGLKQGDVITRVGDESVTNPNEFYSAIQSYIDDETEAVLLRVNRQGNNMFIAIEL